MRAEVWGVERTRGGGVGQGGRCSPGTTPGPLCALAPACPDIPSSAWTRVAAVVTAQGDLRG